MVRTHGRKYVYNAHDIDELYDVRDDPHEMHNRIELPEGRRRGVDRRRGGGAGAGRTGVRHRERGARHVPAPRRARVAGGVRARPGVEAAVGGGVRQPGADTGGYNCGTRAPLAPGEAAVVIGDGLVGHWAAQTLAWCGAAVGTRTPLAQKVLRAGTWPLAPSIMWVGIHMVFTEGRPVPDKSTYSSLFRH